MSAPATPLSAVREDDAACALGRARALIEPQLRLLGRLAEIGLEVTEGVGRQVRGERTRPSRPTRPWPSPAPRAPCA